MGQTIYPECVKAAVIKETARKYAINGQGLYRRRALVLIRRYPGEYVDEVIAAGRRRCRGVEMGIVTNPYWAVTYAAEVLQGRFCRAEPYIAADAVNACRYAEEVIRGRFRAAERFIAADAASAVRYAVYLRRRFPDGEAAIFQDEKFTTRYLRLVVRGQDRALEGTLAGYPMAAAMYACLVLKGRWVAGEETIARNADSLWIYAERVVRGKLPQELHNRMLSHGIRDAKDESVKRYCAFIGG